MTPELLRRIGPVLFGDNWRPALAYELGVSLRVVERWASGHTEMPGALDAELRELATHRADMLSKLSRLYGDRAAALDAMLPSLSPL